MTFTLIDVILIVLVVVFVVAGSILGFVKSLGGFLGAIVGIFVASRVAGPIGDWLAPVVGGNSQIVSIVAFSIVYLVASRLFALLFWIVEKTLGVAAKLPFLSSVDHLLGGIFGFLEGIIAVAAVVYYAGQVLPAGPWQGMIESSQVGAWMLTVFDLVKGLVPAALRTTIDEKVL